jgi:very-short-patch-repair endonuclease
VHFADAAAIELAELQCGAFARWQLLGRGVTVDLIKRRVRDQRWCVALPGVYVLAGVPGSFEQRLWIGWLAVGPGAVVSHESAAQLHAIPDVVRDRVTLTTAHGWHQRLSGIVVHQLDDVLGDHRMALRGLPVTTPARTVVDLAAVVHPARLARIVEDTHHARIASHLEVGRCMASVARRGKPGIGRLARVLDHLTATNSKSMSKLERMLFEVLSAAGLPRPVSQFPFPGRQFTNGCVDAAYADVKLIIEVDGRTWHTRISAIKRDHERDAAAARHGWQTLRLLWEHVDSDPAGMAMLIRDVLRERRLQLAS